jgi:AcrR family transcriptional regulator
MEPMRNLALQPGPDAATTDRRLLRGARARRAIARHAVDVASLEGLNGLSFGRLAADLGLSKAGIQTLFRSKENLQLAAVASAGEQFSDAVARPVQAVAAGASRLRALIDHWIAYAETPLFAGGCFWAANLADFDSRPGLVHDALFRQHRDWLSLIAGELRQAADTGEIADLDPDLTAFQVDAVLMAANTALRLGDPEAAAKIHRVVGGFLMAPRP